MSDLSATYSEEGNDLCGFSCQHWHSGFKKDPSTLLLGQEVDVEDGLATKTKEEIPDCTRASGGRKIPRQQRQRSSAKDKGDGHFVPSGGKHRQTRKRSDGRHYVQAELLKHLEGLASFCASCFRLFISVIVQVTLRCGEGVEAGGKMLYSCCSFSLHDLNTIQTDMQTWIQRGRIGCRKLTRQLVSWLSLTYRLLKMLCAILFLVLMLLLGSMRLCWKVSKSVLLNILSRMTHTSYGAWLLSTIDFPQIGALFRESRICKWMASLLLKWHALLWMPKGLRTTQSGSTVHNDSPGGSGPFEPGEEVARLLAMAHTPEEELNPFQVLGLDATASDVELKRAYRHLAVLVHPDKNEHPQAEEAFKVLRAAWDIVSNPEKKKEYEIKRMAETELTKSMNDFLSKLQDDLKEVMNTMKCNKCQGKHRRFEMDRDPLYGRYCAECSKFHAAEEGDFWAESSMLGLKITYFAMMDGKVYDITDLGQELIADFFVPDVQNGLAAREWESLQIRIEFPITSLLDQEALEDARVLDQIMYLFSPSVLPSPPSKRAASDSSPASAAELQDFFNRIFQGNPGQMPNGNFFGTSQPPGPGNMSMPPASSSKVDSSFQKGDSKQKRRKKVRRPFQR
ncbi:hypothetical protein Chor_012411 [Crotalus horridus]